MEANCDTRATKVAIFSSEAAFGGDTAAGRAYLAPAQQGVRPDLVRNVIRGATAVALLATLSGCGPSYSPNTYSAAAVQQANPVERGEVVGVRQVMVSADATVGTVTGGAAGGIAGSQVDHGGPITALSTLGGTVIGGIVGNGVEHAEGDTTAFEYIVREDAKGSLVSVTQKDKVPLAVGERVLVIAGKQARVVPDYTVSLPTTTPPAKPKVAARIPPTAPAAGVTATALPPVPEASAPGVSAPPVATASAPAPAGTMSPTVAAPPFAALPPASASAPPPSPSPGTPVSLALPSTAAPPPTAVQPSAPVEVVPAVSQPSTAPPVEAAAPSSGTTGKP